jgi:2-hydroxychromene-2-carboxylate isomerase
MTSRFEPNAARLTIVLDIRYPQSYLALHPAAALARSLGVDVDWLPLPVATLKPPSTGAASDDRGVRHRRHRARLIASEIDTYSNIQGLVLRDYYRDGDADVLNLGWLWIRERLPQQLEAYLSEAFRAYWALELDPADEARVVTLVESFGGDGKVFLSWLATEGPAVSRALVDELQKRGVFAVPTYLVDDEVFLGRQHLPMIRWILAGRTGQAPI